jgi:hypothetical protein
MLEDLGNLGDFIGGIAVIVTLIYLALQIRHNTSAVHTASRQEIASGMRAAYRLFMDSNAARAYAEGVRKYPDMPFEERSLFGNMLTDHALFFQGAFALYESGQLEEETYRAYLDWFACNVATPGGVAWWEEVHAGSRHGATPAQLAASARGGQRRTGWAGRSGLRAGNPPPCRHHVQSAFL